MKHAESALEGGRIVRRFHCVRFAPGKLSLRSKAERWLCSWESQMDQMEGMKTGEPLSSSFPMKSSAQLSRIGSPPRGSFPQRKGSTLRLSSEEEEVDGEDVDELLQ